MSTGLDRYFDKKGDRTIYLKGDYTKTFEEAKKYSDKNKQLKYKLIGKNCVWVSIKLLAESYPKDSEERKNLEYLLWKYEGTEAILAPNVITGKFKKAVSLD